MNKDVIGVIPARYGSTRFPGKPLALLGNKPVIQWVYERASQSRTIKKLIVATDDERIYNKVLSFGGEVRMTSSEIRNGTERVAAVATDFDAEIIVNIQGDEPLIEGGVIDMAVQLLIDDAKAVMGTLIKKIDTMEELLNRNLPKVVIDRSCNALYFSRSMIPFNRDIEDHQEWLKIHTYYRHIGLYVYRKKFLKEYVSWPETSLEKAEKLEQLRVLEHGYHIRTALVDYTPQGVDTPEDLELLNKYIKEAMIEQR
ncbi:3-deoxy-manno-octulosonate cytidylyltransferase [candidate division KSB1 bacterium]|nr:3-deoxy-manno-octulosonate cytidylyltransferase [candidate division KSB1 bacterium]